MITLQQLRYFMVTAKLNSFSKASEVLFISQPALSKQITNLEQLLQFILFERTPKGITLTEKGRQFYSQIEPLIQDLDIVLEDVIVPEEIRMGVLSSISSYYLPRIYYDLYQNKIKTSVYHTSAELLELLKSGFLEAAIVQDVKLYKNLKHLFLFEEPYLLALSREHPLAKKDSIELSDLQKETIILPPAPCDNRDAIETAFTQYEIHPDLRIEVPLNESILSYTSNNFGVAIIPEMVALNLTMKNTVYKRFKGEPLKRSLHFFSRSTAVLKQFEYIIQNECCNNQIKVIS